MNVFVSGGCKNGKSYFAQRLAKEMAEEKNLPLYYVATMRPTDEEDKARIRRHIEDRDGWGFVTIEQAEDICKALKQCGTAENREAESIANRRCERARGEAEAESAQVQGVFLLDSVTALLSNEMFAADGSIHPEAGAKVAEDLKRFAELTGNTVFVSDYIYSESRLFDELTEKYRESLALCDRTLAAACEQVYEVTYSIAKSHKNGTNPINGI